VFFGLIVLALPCHGIVPLFVLESLFNIDHFAAPEALFLLLLIPAYLFWYFRYFQKQRLVIRLSYDPARMQNTPRFSLTLMRIFPRLLQLTALAMMIVAVARPQVAREVQTRLTEGIDIMLLLDTSGSMKTGDFVPNRLEVAKRTAVNFIEGRPGDRIGLVLFAQDAYSYAPLTLDHDYLKQLIKDINHRTLPPQGTAIGSAIATGINRMRASENASRIMILLTDGANNRGLIDPLTAARLAEEYSIRLYCIGVGQPQTSTVNASNQGVELDEATLKRMAALTGGTYFRATRPERLQEVFGTISQLETRPIEEDIYRHVKDRYPMFLKMAMVLLGLSFLSMLTFVYNPLEQ
jgi:Ca-activated chloride channel family protein